MAASMTTAASTPAHPLIVHAGALDLASYGDQLYPLVAGHELARRLDGARVAPFGPIGSTGTAAGAGAGAATWALGHWSERRARAVAESATLVLVGGGEVVQGNGAIYGPFYGLDPRDTRDLGMDRWYIEGLGAAERDCPVVWHAPGVPGELDVATAERVRRALEHRALVAVRDEHSRRLLEAAGVEREIAVVPDSALLLPRVLPAGGLAGRRERLRAAGHYAPDGPVIVVQGNHTMTGLAPALAAALHEIAPDARIVTVAVSPCHNDHLFAAAVRDHARSQVWSVPEHAPVEDVAAAIAGADCFLGVSLHGAITALAYDRPFVTLDPFEQAKLRAFAELIGWPGARTSDVGEAVRRAARRACGDDLPPPTLPALQARVDAHFDRVAELAEAQVRSGRPLRPLGWDDTAAPLQLRLRRPPRPAVPAPEADPPGVRRPDVVLTDDEVRTALDEALAARLALRDEQASDAQEVERLQREVSDLRGAIAHLEGMVRHAERQVAEHEKARREAEAEREQLEAANRRHAEIVAAARGSRAFRYTRLPRALREDPG
jgi:hypothetical protein